jgi:hypothetical protein
LFAGLVLLSTALVLGGAAPAVPDYEVKLLLDPAQVLAAGHKPTLAVREALRLHESATKLWMLFLDSHRR